MKNTKTSEVSAETLAANLRNKGPTFSEIGKSLNVSESTARTLFNRWQLANNVVPVSEYARQNVHRDINNERLKIINAMLLDQKTLADIAQVLNISRSRVAQIIALDGRHKRCTNFVFAGLSNRSQNILRYYLQEKEIVISSEDDFCKLWNETDLKVKLAGVPNIGEKSIKEIASWVEHLN